MKKYVLVYPRRIAANRFTGTGMVMLITKAKPDFQKGRLNLVGGKVEEGESFMEAAEREFKEETKITGVNFQKVGEVKGSDFYMEVFTCEVSNIANPSGLPDEPVAWYNWYDVRRDARLMPNLRIIIPFCITRERGWRLTSQVEGHMIGDPLTIETNLSFGVPYAHLSTFS